MKSNEIEPNEIWRELLYACTLEAIKKVWRFDVNRITEYSRKKAESELVQLFPDIARKGLKLKMWYLDDLAGEVSNTDNLVL